MSNCEKEEHKIRQKETFPTILLLCLNQGLLFCLQDVMAMDGVPYDLTERQVYEVGQQVAVALVSLLMLAAFVPSCSICMVG